MITFEQAKETATRYLISIWDVSDDTFVITRTQEEDFCWIFFWQSEKFLMTGKVSHVLTGNAPLIISKKDGKIYSTGEPYDLNHWVKLFREGKLSPVG